jgi:ribosomal protein L11 methyltransferase
VSGDSSPALIIRFPPGTPSATRDRLVALLADHDLVAIHEDDPTTPACWTAHFGSPGSRDEALAAIGALEGTELHPEPVEIEDDDWARRTQADLPAIRVGRVVVAPPWDPPVPGPNGGAQDVVAIIEPSRGFGTGHHQSTRLCLVLLQNRDLAGRTVIDVGTGSGVLAIVAAKLGAAFVSALDVDPDAVENARENIARNGVEAIAEAHVLDLTGAVLGPADLACANLTGTLLVRHAHALAATVKRAGSLIVSGFTVEEKDAVLDAFSGAFDLSEAAEEDDWWAFVLTRREGLGIVSLPGS